MSDCKTIFSTVMTGLMLLVPTSCLWALQVTSDLGFYDGSVADGKPDGIGLFVFSRGRYEYFQGEFTNGQIDGEGQLKFRDGTLCTGTFNSNFDTPVAAVCRQKNGVVYTGKLTGGQRDGKGVVTDTKARKYFCVVYENGKSILRKPAARPLDCR